MPVIWSVRWRPVVRPHLNPRNIPRRSRTAWAVRSIMVLMAEDQAELAPERADLEAKVLWRGVVIAEGLQDPRLINSLRVYQAHITEDGQVVDYEGPLGRWHLYWVEVSEAEIERIQEGTLPGWYAHFWQGEDLLVVFHDARFRMLRTDQATWEAARAHGRVQGIPADQLDFPTDESVGTLNQH